MTYTSENNEPMYTVGKKNFEKVRDSKVVSGMENFSILSLRHILTNRLFNRLPQQSIWKRIS